MRVRLSFSNVISLLALFIALGGASYAAFKLPRNSVGPTQLRNNAVTSGKVRNHSLRAVDFAKGQLPSGKAGATGLTGLQGPQGPTGTRGAPGSNGASGTNGTTTARTGSASTASSVRAPEEPSQSTSTPGSPRTSTPAT